jgi:DUF4097 and DUF4098 domain-containing protein YvlB
MMRRRRSELILTVVVALVLFTALACTFETVEGKFEQMLKVTGQTEIDLTTGSGNITVRTGEGQTVRIVGHIFAHYQGRRRESAEKKVQQLEANPPIEQNGNVIRIGRIDDRELQRGVGISYELTVPANTRLRADSGSGNIDGTGLRAGVEANTGSGSIRLVEVGAEVRAQTGSGEIEITQKGSGDVRASTGSGSIRASGVSGAMRASTGSGSISVEGKLSGPWELETGSGSITVQLPTVAAFELDAHTGSGEVHTNHPITVVGSFAQGTLKGAVRGGGPRLMARTGSGSIEIE